MASENLEVTEIDRIEESNQLSETCVTPIDVDLGDDNQITSSPGEIQPIYNIAYHFIDKIETLIVETAETAIENQEKHLPTLESGNAVSGITEEQNTLPSPSPPISNQDEDLSTSVRPKQNVFQQFLRLFQDTTKGLRLKLQQFYRKATLPCISWLDNGQDLIMSEYYTELELDESFNTIPIHKIFANIDKRNSRILIEGQPGYGKTTLATKLVHDWAHSKSYIKHFKLVFLIPLRELRQRNVTKAVADIAKCCGYCDIKSVNEVLRDNLADTLLIIDGLDELSTTERMHILKILYGQEFIDASVIVTCRTGLFILEESEKIILSGGISTKKEFYDKRVTVKGIGIKDRKSFLLKFASRDTTRVILENMQQLPESTVSMFSSPLFLILLAFMASKTSDLTSLRTKTQFFKKFFNYIVNHSMKKTTRLDEEIDLFEIDLPTNNAQKTIQKFGELSLSHIRANNLQFEHNKLTTKVYNLGLLMNHKEISTFDTKSNYEAFHLTILEFSVAYSIWVDFKEKGRIAFDYIVPLYLKLGDTSLIFVFLVGLLQNDAKEFFQHLLPNAYIFSSTKNSLYHFLTDYEENSDTDALLSVLVNFLPPTVQHTEDAFSHFYKSNFSSRILKIGIQSGKLKAIFLDCLLNSALPGDVTIPRLHINLPLFHAANINKWLGSNSFDELTVRFDASFVQSESNAMYWFNFWKQHQSKSLSIELSFPRRPLDPNVEKTLIDNLGQSNVKNLLLDVRFDFDIEYTALLLKKNQIESLQLVNLKQDSKKILDLLPKSSKLTSFQLLHGSCDVPIDLYDLTNRGEKQYRCLMLEMSPVVCKKPLANKNCVYCILSKSIKGDVLNMINPTILGCDAYAFAQLTSSWTGYLSLKEFVVYLNVLDQTQFWKHLSRCKNLTMLELRLFDNPQLASIDEVISCLQQIPIETLVINYVFFMQRISNRFLESITTSLPWSAITSDGLVNQHPLRTIVLDINFDSEDFSPIVKILLNCLKLNQLSSVYLICNEDSFWYYLAENQVIDCSLFTVSCIIWGSSSNDPIYQQILYGSVLFDNRTYVLGGYEFNVHVQKMPGIAYRKDKN